MAKYNVLKKFRLLDDVNVSGIGPVHEAGEVIDIKVKRADQAIKTLGSSFLERADTQDDDQDDVAEEIAEGIENKEEAK